MRIIIMEEKNQNWWKCSSTFEIEKYIDEEDQASLEVRYTKEGEDQASFKLRSVWKWGVQKKEKIKQVSN
jgi:hypothetical protein